MNQNQDLKDEKGLPKQRKGAGLGRRSFPGRGESTKEIQQRGAQNLMERECIKTGEKGRD